MSYFPTDIPFMSDEELIKNGLKKPYKKPEIIKGTDLVPVVRCKDCKHFELNPVTVIDDIPLILAHEICTFWGNGCKTAQDGFCSFGERREE